MPSPFHGLKQAQSVLLNIHSLKETRTVLEKTKINIAIALLAAHSLKKRTAPQYEIGTPETGIIAYAVLMPQDKDHTLLLEPGVAVQWGNLDLNQGPTGYESAALTTELLPQ